MQHTSRTIRSRPIRWATATRHAGAILLAGWLAAAPSRAADPIHAWRTLERVQRVAVVAPFFCTDAEDAPAQRAIRKEREAARVARPMPGAPRAPAEEPTVGEAGQTAGTTAGDKADGQTYRECLRSLTATMRQSLPQRVGESGRFTLAPAEQIEQALKALRWTPRDLFLNRAALYTPPPGKGAGRLNTLRELFRTKDAKRKAGWPRPDPKRAAALAKRLGVDAVLFGAMREPASVGEGLRVGRDAWNPNPLNFRVERIRPHVLSPRVQAYLVTAKGETAWRDELMADHPRTKPRTLKTLRVDWEEATVQVAQQLADSLHRLPPKARP